MTQDLFDWLNSTHDNKAKDNKGTGGLLLAPMLDGRTYNLDAHDEDISPELELPEIDALTPQDNIIDENLQEKITALNDAWHAEDLDTEDYPLHEASHSEPEDSLTYEDADADSEDTLSYEDTNADSEDTLAYKDTASNSEDIPLHEGTASDSEDALAYECADSHEDTNADSEYIPSYEDVDSDSEDSLSYYDAEQHNDEDINNEDYSHEEHASILNQAWHEAAGFQLNLDEPPPQMWIDIDEDSEDEPRDYEENHSLQGDAYIPVVKHGANFTQRLQSTLKTRKDRAAKQHELDAENANPHPYVQKAIIFCGVLLMTLGFAYLGLWFVQRETPDSLNERAATQYEKGNYDEAANLYGRGYKRYPHVLSFLTGLARSAEKAGRTQTAIAAWNEYMSSLPKDDAEHRLSAQRELDKLIPGGDTQTQMPEPQQVQTVMLPQTKPKSQDIPHAAARPSLPEIKPATFDEALEEGSRSFNIGMFSRAISSFHRAHAIRPDDLRPYVGLIAGYRAKGMYFEAKRLIDEAVKKFGRVPALEMESYYLRRE